MGNKENIKMKKAFYFSNTDFYLFHFRLGLMREMQKRGFKVYACGDVTESCFPEQIEKNGIDFIRLPLRRDIDLKGGDIRYLWRVYNLCRKEKPFLCHNFTIKPNIFAVIAQRCAGVKNIYVAVTGLGYVFVKEKSLLRRFVICMYKASFRFCRRVFFQNPDDMKLLLEAGCLKKEKAVLIKSSGVNTEIFSSENIDKSKAESIRQEIGLKKTDKMVLMGCRLLWDKGVGEFVEAAKRLKEKAVFVLAGPLDDNPSVVSENEIKRWEQEGIIKYLGNRRDIREVIDLSDIVVLPSYREGVPKVLLEAGAMSKPVITTDVSGCREAVDDGVNGILVEPKNVEELAGAVSTLLKRDDLRRQYGEAGKKKVVREFEEKDVVKSTVEQYGIL
jgi:glycosyltransferase involved in cell wall biosynthesis